LLLVCINWLSMKRILFVHDDEDFLEAMKIFLWRQGHEVAVTTTCTEGLEILRAFHPDLILLDVRSIRVREQARSRS